MKKKWTLFLSMLSLVVGAQLLSLRAEAQVVCGTLAECQEMEAHTQTTLGRIQARIRELEESAGTGLGEILRDAAGYVRHLSQFDAERACQELGTRLPTARELAVYAKSRGARGIRETAYAEVETTHAAVVAEMQQMHRDGYAPVYVTNSAGLGAVDFYFNSSGYQRPEGELANFWYWSSSVAPAFADISYGLHGYDGTLGTYERSDVHEYIAIRCVRLARSCQSERTQAAILRGRFWFLVLGAVSRKQFSGREDGEHAVKHEEHLASSLSEQITGDSVRGEDGSGIGDSQLGGSSPHSK